MRIKNLLLQTDLKIRKRNSHFGILGAALSVMLLAGFITGCSKDAVVTDQSAGNSLGAAAISETLPADKADTVAINPVVAVTFKSATLPSEVSAATFTLMNGTTPIAGTLTFSGNTATFTPAVDLAAETWFTATIKINHTKSTDGDHGDSKEHSWKFKTGKHRRANAPSVVSVLPLKSALLVAITVQPTVTFSEVLHESATKAMIFTLKQGTTAVAGTVTFSGKTATFVPAAALTANLEYTGTVSFGVKDEKDDKDDMDDDTGKTAESFTWNFTTGVGVADVAAPTISTVVPANNATAVAVTGKATVNFSEAMSVATINATTFTLKQGTTVVAGAVTYAGTTATFTPAAALTADLVYTGTITTGAKDAAGNALAANYTWSFTTGAGTADVVAPTVLTSAPANNATEIAVNSKPAVTFSEAMTASTITSTTFTVKQGTIAVAGTVTYAGTTATFTPASALTGGLVYTGTVMTGVKDAAGNAIAANYSWSFTTAAAVVVDVTPPTVLTIVPASGATSIAVGSKITAAFSETMTASTITASTFTVKQGATAVAGAVAYSGTTATFTPSAALAGGLVYTVTITTGAKDAAGNSIAASYSWDFTTVASVAVTSFATQVWPILQGKCTTCHGTTGGSAGINMGNYTQVAALTNTQLDNTGMFSKGGVTAAEQTIIKAWIAGGKLNN